MPTTGNNIRANTYIHFFSLPLNVVSLSLSLFLYLFFSLLLFPPLSLSFPSSAFSNYQDLSVHTLIFGSTLSSLHIATIHIFHL